MSRIQILLGFLPSPVYYFDFGQSEEPRQDEYAVVAPQLVLLLADEGVQLLVCGLCQLQHTSRSPSSILFLA